MKKNENFLPWEKKHQFTSPKLPRRNGAAKLIGVPKSDLIWSPTGTVPILSIASQA